MRSNVSWPDLLYLKSNEVKCQKWAGWDSGSVSHCGSQPPQVNIFISFYCFRFRNFGDGTTGGHQQMNKASLEKLEDPIRCGRSHFIGFEKVNKWMLVRDAGRLVQSLGDPSSAQSEKVNIWMLEDLDWRALSRCGRSHLTWLESLKGEMRGGRSTFIYPEKMPFIWAFGQSRAILLLRQRGARINQHSRLRSCPKLEFTILSIVCLCWTHTNKQLRGSWESKTEPKLLCCVLSTVQCVVELAVCSIVSIDKRCRNCLKWSEKFVSISNFCFPLILSYFIFVSLQSSQEIRNFAKFRRISKFYTWKMWRVLKFTPFLAVKSVLWQFTLFFCKLFCRAFVWKEIEPTIV